MPGRTPHGHPPTGVVGARLASVVVLREKIHRTGGEGEETTVTESVVKFKTFDKLRSLELLGRHLGMFKDKVEHSGDVSLLDVCRRIEAEEDAAKQRRPA